MAQPGFPNAQSLAQMEFLPAFAFQQMRGQSALANQFAQQDLAQGEQDLQAKQLANLFSQQSNPLKLEQSRLNNAATGHANLKSQMENEDYQATRTERVSKDRAEALAKASTAELLQLQNRAKQAMASGNPEEVAKGTKVFDASWEEMTRRRNAEDKRQLQKEESAAAFARTKYVQDRQDSREDKRLAAKATAGKKSADTLGEVIGGLKGGKLNFEKANVALAGILADPDIPEQDRAAAMQLRAQLFEEMMKAKEAGRTGQVDTGNLGGMPTIPRPSPSVTPPQAVAQPAARPAAAAPATPQAPSGRVVIYKDGKAVGSIPQNQVDAAKAQGYTVK